MNSILPPAYEFLKTSLKNREIILSVTSQEIRARYAGSVGGIFWSIIGPVALMIILWMVFELGFRAAPIRGFPFILVLICGLIPYQTFNESCMASANSITNRPYLVKKTTFQTELLPLTSILSNLPSHIAMLGLLLILIPATGHTYSAYNLQAIYYLFCLVLLCTGIGWFVSALNVIHRDTSHGLGVILNLWFWITPIVWQQSMVPPDYRFLFHLNPLIYIIEGYRKSFLYSEGFWTDLRSAAIFWAITIVFISLGSLIFKRLKPDFADTI